MSKRKRNIKKNENKFILESRIFQPGINFFQNLPEPKKGDWLWEYQEKGQSFFKYQKTCPYIHSKRNIIYIVGFMIDENETNENDSNKILGQPYDYEKIFPLIEEYCKIFFNVENSKFGNVKFLKNIKLYKKKNENDIDINNMWFYVKVLSRNKKFLLEKKIRYRIGLDHDNIQLKVNDVLKVLKWVIPKDGFNCVGLTMFDLYDVPKTLFCSGMASNNICCLSFSRYDPFYLQKKKNCEYITDLRYFEKDEKFSVKERERLILFRGIKTLTHEIMHNIGSAHCITCKCLMQGTGNILEDFRAPFFLCYNCLKKLYYFSKFDAVKRYESMKKFFEKFNLNAESKWVGNRIKYIEKDIPNEVEVIKIDDDDDDDEIRIIKKQKL